MPSTWCPSSFKSAVHILSFARITMAPAPSFSHRALMHKPALPSSLPTLALRKTCAALTWPPCWLLAHPHQQVTARHVQALRFDLRAETLSHAAGLTAHTAIVLFGSSKFLGRDELGHSRTTVGLTRSRGVTVLAGPPDPYGLIGMVQTLYCYYFTCAAQLGNRTRLSVPYRPQDIMATIRPLEPVSWGPVPLALRITFPDAACHALRLTLRRRRLPRDERQVIAPDGSPVYPKAVYLCTGSRALYYG